MFSATFPPSQSHSHLSCVVSANVSPIQPKSPFIVSPLYLVGLNSSLNRDSFHLRPTSSTVSARTRSGFIMPCSEMSFHGKMASLSVHSRNSLVSTNLWCYHNSCGVLEITAVGRRRSVRGKGAAAVEECGMSTLRPTGISAYIKVTSSGP